jgi:hypothetical protein
MSFTRSTTDVHVHRNMPDYPTGAGISASDLKTAFDSEAEGLQDDLNRLETELEETTAAGNIGATPLAEGDDSGATVQDKLEKLQSEIQEATLGQIPDGTITEAKLNDEFAAAIPKKDDTLQTGLNAEKINGKTDAQLKSDIIGTPSYTDITFAGHTTSGTVTETKTYNVVNSRYLLLIVTGYSNCRKILLDLKSANSYRMVYAEGGNYFVSKTNSAKLLDSSVQGKVTLTTAYSSGVLTLNVTKQKTDSNIPADTLTVYELGGIV